VYVKSELIHQLFPPPLFLFYRAELAGLKALAALDALVVVDDMLFLDTAGNSAHRTLSGAARTALAGVGDGVGHQRLAGRSRTLVVVDMILVHVSEVSESRQYRVRRSLAQSAERAVLDLAGQLFELFDVSVLALSVCDPFKDLQ